MSNELEKIHSTGIVQKDFFEKVSQFQMHLNADPDDSDVSVNELANNSSYVSIGVIEKKLDELFSGLYKISCLEFKQIANELVVIARIEYFHPIAGVWLHRDGVGGAQIRWAKGVDITDMNGKYKNALVADAPHAYAEAIKNAAKKIGNIFGRNLNRDDDYSEYDDFTSILGDYDVISQELNACKTVADFKAVWLKHEDMHESIAFKKMFLKARKEKNV